MKPSPETLADGAPGCVGVVHLEKSLLQDRLCDGGVVQKGPPGGVRLRPVPQRGAAHLVIGDDLLGGDGRLGRPGLTDQREAPEESAVPVAICQRRCRRSSSARGSRTLTSTATS